jgi:hypothetical protein
MREDGWRCLSAIFAKAAAARSILILELSACSVGRTRNIQPLVKAFGGKKHEQISRHIDCFIRAVSTSETITSVTG